MTRYKLTRIDYILTIITEKHTVKNEFKIENVVYKWNETIKNN